MTLKLNIPERLWSARDAAIAGLWSGAPDQQAERALQEWVLSDEAYDQITEDDDTGIGLVCELECSFEDVRDRIGLPPSSDISVQDLAQFVRLMMESSREDGCGPFITAHSISDSSGRQAVLGLLALAAGQGGMEFSWKGLYTSSADLIQSVRDSGCAVDSWLPGDKTFDDYDDEELALLIRG